MYQKMSTRNRKR